MEPITFADAAEATGGTTSAATTASFRGVSIDSRRVEPGQLFVAIIGDRHDGHRFLDQALAAGAAGVVVSERSSVPSGTSAIVVTDTRRALGEIAALHRRRLDVRVAAITGSNGKTTVRDMLAAILVRRFRVVSAERSYNNDIGVPLTAFRLTGETEVGVFELEMNEIGGTRRLAEICRPSVGVVTNVGDSHLESMGSREGVAREKAELLEVLPEDGAAVLNADDPMVVDIGRRHARCPVVSFGIERPSDVFAADVRESDLDRVEFLLQGQLPVRLSMPGTHNVANCLAACAAARVFGVDFAVVPGAMEGFRPPPMRLTVHRLAELTLIEDCYNSNPQSLRLALDLLCRHAPKGRRVAFLGDMLELGRHAVEAHTDVGRRAADCLDRVAFVGKLAAHAAAVAVKFGMPATHVRIYPDSEAARGGVFDMLKAGDTMLVKGSRAIKMEKIVKSMMERYGN